MGDKTNSFGDKSGSGKSYRNGSVNGYYGGEAMPFSQFEEDTDSFDYQRIIEGLLKYKWLIIFCTLLGGVLAWFLVQNLTPMYRTSGTLLIKDQSRGQFYAGSDLSSMLSRSYGIGIGSPLENEMQLIMSRMFAGRVADEILRREIMADGGTFPILLDEEFPGELVHRNSVIGRFMRQMNVERLGRDIDIVTISFESISPEEAREIVDIAMDMYVLVSREQSRASIGSALTFLNEELIDIGRTLESSEDRLQTFMEDRGAIKLDQQTTQLLNQVSMLEVELQNQRIQLTSLRQALNNYESELNEIRPGFADQLNQAIAPRLDLLQRGLAELKVERMLILGKNPDLEGNEMAEPRLREINRELATYRKEINNLTGEITQSGTWVGFLDSERGNIAGRVAELSRLILETGIKINQLEAQELYVSQRLDDFNAEFENIPANMIQMARLQREMQVNQELYVTLSRQQGELMLLEQTQMGNGRIFDYAVTPRNPFYPRVNITLLLGIMLGFGLSAGVVTLMMLMNRRIDSIDRLKAYDPPLLAVVPEMNTMIKEQFSNKQYVEAGDRLISSSLVSLLDPVSHVAESYRRLYNNVRFSNPDSEHNILVVTSATKGEGKSTCVSNLAIAIAESGKSVLLIDCDYRRPRIHRVFGISKEPGSSNHLFEETALEDVITQSIVPGVDLLPAGTEPPSPGLAINSQKMQQLLEKVRQDYDYVLIDTPPYGIITDAAPLMKMSDGVILVTRFNLTTTPELDQILENLNNINANIIGTVLNEYDPEIASGYYSYNKMYAYNYSVYKSYQKEEKELS
jgi:capsular exopolysaccharide synthesis family protein